MVDSITVGIIKWGANDGFRHVTTAVCVCPTQFGSTAALVVVVVLAASSPPHNTQTTGDINQPTTIKSKTQQQLQVKRYHKGRNKITNEANGSPTVLS